MLSTVGPTVVSLAVLLEVPGALLFALVLLGQVPPLLALPGVALVVAGVALVVRGQPAARRWSSRPPERRLRVIIVARPGVGRVVDHTAHSATPAVSGRKGVATLR